MRRGVAVVNNLPQFAFRRFRKARLILPIAGSRSSSHQRSRKQTMIDVDNSPSPLGGARPGRRSSSPRRSPCGRANRSGSSGSPAGENRRSCARWRDWTAIGRHRSALPAKPSIPTAGASSFCSPRWSPRILMAPSIPAIASSAFWQNPAGPWTRDRDGIARPCPPAGRPARGLYRALQRGIPIIHTHRCCSRKAVNGLRRVNEVALVLQ
jgi:hypothetical protein